MFKNSKISKVVLIGLLCGIFLPIVVTYIFFINNYKERSAQTMNIITESYSISATEALWFFSDEWTKVVVQSAVKNEKIYSASIHDNQNKLLVKHQENLPSLNTKVIKSKLEKNGDSLGTLTLVFKMNEINKDIYIEKSNLLWILLFQAIVSSLILYFIIRYKVLLPIKKLTLQSKLLSTKKLNKIFVWEQKDEMGQLGNAMNKTRLSLQKMFKKLESKLIYDNLTKVYNRNGFEEIFDVETKRCERYQNPFSMIMFDIDFFKQVNDTHGHLIGDKVLVSICTLIQSQIRESDYLVRWGGEEFLILVPEVELSGALKLAEKLRKAVDEYTFETASHITISLSVAQKDEQENTENFIKRIDDLLYESKHTGRNKISV
mgnify:CR=1 FL=1